MCLKYAGCVANSVDPDQTPQNAASDQGLHCLLSSLWSNIFLRFNHYENTPIQIYWEFYHQKMKIFRWKILISAQNTDCRYSLDSPRWAGSNEYPQSMFLSRNKKNNVYPCKPQFYYIKVGFMGIKIIQACFRDVVLWFSFFTPRKERFPVTIILLHIFS